MYNRRKNWFPAFTRIGTKSKKDVQISPEFFFIYYRSPYIWTLEVEAGDNPDYYPHSTVARDKNNDIYKYQEWTPNDRNPNNFDAGKRFDGGKPDGRSGAAHKGVPTPHMNIKKETDGTVVPKGVRLPNPKEYPNNGRFWWTLTQ